MLNIILFDSEARDELLPLTATRPMGELRLGILTLREKWERMLNGSVSYITQEYLQEKFPIQVEEENLIINAGLLPSQALCDRIKKLRLNEALLCDGELLAARLNEARFESLIDDEEISALRGTEIEEDIPLQVIKQLWDFTQLNEKALNDDFDLITKGRKSQALAPSNQVIGSAKKIFLEEGANIECCIFNTNDGPIYIGKNTEVMEGSKLRGPIAIGDNCIVKMDAKIYGPSTFGPGCRLGGEITRSIFIGNSNKAHDGYLGDSIIGEWCNFGADSNNSNLKNNYSEVKLWSYATERFEKTGQQFFGLVMGDHSKCAINSMFNTGTIVGVAANIFGAGFLRNFIPDFSWGGPGTPYRTYKYPEACETAALVMARRNQPFTDMEKAILYHVYDQSARFRTWDK